MGSRHEERVKAFIRQAQANDPERYREVCDAYPVLSEFQLRSRRKRELPLEVLDV